MSLVTIKGLRREIGASVILADVAASISAGERIGLVGPNGAGKTTLLRLIAGKDEPDAGRVDVSRGLRIDLLSQESAQDPALLAASSLTDAVRGGAGEIVALGEELRRMELEGAAATSGYAEARQRFDALDGYALEDRIAAALSGLGFPSARHAERPQQLSGGEQTRLALARLVIADPDLLLLDEPTNHLDIDSRAALIEAINDFPGATILVSHDRHLLDACADRLWLVANRAVTPFDGDLDDYRRRVLSDRSEPAAKRHEKDDRTAKANGKPADARPRVNVKALKKQVEKAEAEIERLTKHIETLDAQLADGTLFARDPAKATTLTRSRADSADALAKAEEDWLAAGAALQGASV